MDEPSPKSERHKVTITLEDLPDGNVELKWDVLPKCEVNSQASSQAVRWAVQVLLAAHTVATGMADVKEVKQDLLTDDDCAKLV